MESLAGDRKKERSRATPDDQSRGPSTRAAFFRVPYDHLSRPCKAECMDRWKDGCMMGAAVSEGWTDIRAGISKLSRWEE